MLFILSRMMIRIHSIFDEMLNPARLSDRWKRFLSFQVYFIIANFQKCNFRNRDRAFLLQILFTCFLLVNEIFRFDILAWVACFIVIAFDSFLVIIKHSLLAVRDRLKTGGYLEHLDQLVLFDCCCFYCYIGMITFRDLFAFLLLMMMNGEGCLLMVYQKHCFYFSAIKEDASANQQILKALAQLVPHHLNSLFNLLNIDFPFKVAKFLDVN